MYKYPEYSTKSWDKVWRGVAKHAHIEDIVERYKSSPSVSLPNVWQHGPTLEAWKWSEDSMTFTYTDGFLTPPTRYCLGDRMIHADYGLDSYGIIWVGSTSANWHGSRFGYDLKRAIEWVQQADFRDVGPYLWSRSVGK